MIRGLKKESSVGPYAGAFTCECRCERMAISSSQCLVVGGKKKKKQFEWVLSSVSVYVTELAEWVKESNSQRGTRWELSL